MNHVPNVVWPFVGREVEGVEKRASLSCGKKKRSYVPSHQDEQNTFKVLGRGRANHEGESQDHAAERKKKSHWIAAAMEPCMQQRE